MKVYAVELLFEYDGQVDTEYEIFDNLDKAKQCMEDWKDNYKHFIEDIQTDIDNGSEDSIIEEKERLLNGKNGSYFYAYDSFNFEALTINIKEKEIR